MCPNEYEHSLTHICIGGSVCTNTRVSYARTRISIFILPVPAQTVHVLPCNPIYPFEHHREQRKNYTEMEEHNCCTCLELEKNMQVFRAERPETIGL